jgi:hypothetical protein
MLKVVAANGTFLQILVQKLASPNEDQGKHPLTEPEVRFAAATRTIFPTA